jgi:hypothetical protein
MISGLNHLTLSVRDIDRSFRFDVEVARGSPIGRRAVCPSLGIRASTRIPTSPRKRGEVI